MSKLDEMMARKVTLVTKIRGIKIAVSKDHFHVGNDEMKLVYRAGKDDEYGLIKDMFTTATRNANNELEEIDAKINAINELLEG